MIETATTNFVNQYEPGTQAPVQLKNGRVLDVVNGRYHDAGTSIVLKGGEIVSMPGHSAGPSGIAPDFTIDLQGKTVLPGLFNTHIHGPESSPSQFPGLRDRRLVKKFEEKQIIKNFTECLAHGVTNVRHAGFVADLRNNQARMARLSAAKVPAPRIPQAVVVGPAGSYMQEDLPRWLKMMGMPQVDPSKEYAAAVAFPIEANEQQVRDAVDMAIDERGADVIKIGDEPFSLFARKSVPVMTQEQLSALADQARRRGLQTMMHHTTVASLRRGIKAGVSSLAHLPYDARLSQTDVEAFKASGCFCEPTLSVFYAAFSWKLAGDEFNHNPELDRLTEFRQKTFTFAHIADEYYLPELREAVMNGYKKVTSGKPKIMGIIDNSGFYGWDAKAAFTFENFALLFENDVPMSTGNDTVAPCTPAMVGLELLMFDHVLKGDADRAPFSGAEAARIATINSARSLGVDDKLGSIEVGKTADLVILDGDPLEDFRLIGGRVAALFMDGELVINNCRLEVASNGKA